MKNRIPSDVCRINLWVCGARAPGLAPRGAPRLRVAPLNKRKKGERKREKREKKGKKGRKEGKERIERGGSQ